MCVHAIGLEETALDVEDGVVALSLVETDGQALALSLPRHRELHLVPVAVDLLGGNNGSHLDRLETADALERVLHLFGLERELGTIVHVLEPAAPAPPKVRAWRFHPMRRRLLDGLDEAPTKTRARLIEADAEAVARDASAHEDDVTVCPADTFPSECEVVDSDGQALTTLGARHGSVMIRAGSGGVNLAGIYLDCIVWQPATPSSMMWPTMGTRASRNPVRVGSLLTQAVPALAERLLEETIRKEWAQVIGPEAARHSRPVALRQSVLEVSVDNSPWLQELTLRGASIASRLQERHGAAVSAVRFVLATKTAAGAPAAPARSRADVPLRQLSAEEARQVDD